MADLVVQRPEGLYCPPGDFYIDPWRPVPRAVITHAHSDHARAGHGHYLAHSGDALGLMGGKENCTVKALRHAGRDVDISPAFKGVRRRARRHTEPGNFAQHVRQLVGHPITEVFVFPAPADIHERQDRD